MNLNENKGLCIPSGQETDQAYSISLGVRSSTVIQCKWERPNISDSISWSVIHCMPCDEIVLCSYWYFVLKTALNIICRQHITKTQLYNHPG